MERKVKNPQGKIDQEILDLAVNCRFISLEQEKEILPIFFQFSKKNIKNPAARFLLEKKILPKERIELLFSIKKHIDTLMADKRFGRIGVANDFVTAQNVKKALDLQVAIFRKKKKSIKIGDILVSNKEMSLENQTAVLLTQDRIKDELLADALNTIAGSEIERIEINKRFGAIAVKKELITTQQLNQALKVQRNESENKGANRYLGQILKQLFNLSDKDILNILKIQKKFEVKRINLKEHVVEFNSEKERNQTFDSFFEYHVSEDKLSAFVHRKAPSEKPTKVKDFLSWLSLSGICFGLCPDEEIESFLIKNDPGDQLRVARGNALTLPGETKVEYFFDTQIEPEKHPVVKKGATLAKVMPGEKGAAGTNIFGRPIALPNNISDPLACGEGVALKENEFIATIDGYPRLYRNRTLFVMPAVREYARQKVQGDIAADIDEPDTIYKVDGNILPGIHVRCRQLNIKGDILGKVTAGSDVDVHGTVGMLPEKENSKVLEPVSIETQGHIFVAKNIIHATLWGARGIKGTRSDLISSTATSFSEIVLKNILSTKECPSVLTIGRNEFFELKKLNQAIEEITDELQRIQGKNELNELSKELMAQVQIQNGYLEKQNVIIFLNQILKDPQWDSIQGLSKKVAAFEKAAEDNDSSDMDIVIPPNTKAHKFMVIILKKIDENEPKDQEKYVDELHDNISGLYKAAVKVTERINKKYEARAKAIAVQVIKIKSKIEEKEKNRDTLIAKRDYLQLKQEEKGVRTNPMVKVKNQVSPHTVIKGETCDITIDKDIYGVCFKEEKRESKEDSKINIEGYFE